MSNFPHVDEQRGFQATFGIIEARGNQQLYMILVYKAIFLRASTRKLSRNLESDGFTFNRLQPYTVGMAIPPSHGTVASLL